MKNDRTFFRSALSAAALAVSLVAVGCGGPPKMAPAPGPAVIPIAQPATSQATGAIEAAPPPAVIEAWSDADAFVPVTSEDPSWGNRDALVTLVEFSDFQCPFCSRVEPTVASLREIYGPTKLRIVWKNLPLPFHNGAKPAAEAAQGVFTLGGNDAFWRMHDELFRGQFALSGPNLDRWLVRWAEDSGVGDLARFRDGLESHAFAEKVEKDLALAKTVGATGTPAFFVNGVFLSGAHPIEKFRTTIDQELAKAEAKLAAGTPRNRVYVAMSQENKAAQPAPKDDDVDDTTTVFKVPASGPAQGPRTALVTIVEFSDFQCPFCAKVAPTLKALRAKYGDKLRIVWKNEPLPFHNRASAAANLAMEARAQRGDAGFWAAHDRIFAAQASLDDSALEGIAAAMGLNVVAARVAIQTEKHKGAIETDMDLSDDFQATGTPHFFINGRRLVGAQPQEKFEKIIDQEIVKAQALLAKGTAPAAVYDALTQGGKGPPPPEKKTVAAAPNAPFKGNPNAKVVVQVFSDFQCPFCGRVLDATREVMRVYGTRIKLVWRNMPLPMHPAAPLAAEAAMEAFKQKGSAGFWAMHDMLFANQQDLERATLDGYAQKLGLDLARWQAALDGSAHKALIDADTKAGNDGGISGTPSFVINGYYLSGAQPFAKFRKIIDRALLEAR